VLRFDKPAWASPFNGLTADISVMSKTSDESWVITFVADE